LPEFRQRLQGQPTDNDIALAAGAAAREVSGLSGPDAAAGAWVVDRAATTGCEGASSSALADGRGPRLLARQ